MSPLFLIFLTVFIDMVGFGIIIPVLPLYAEHFHASPVEIGWLTGITPGCRLSSFRFSAVCQIALVGGPS